MLHSPRSLLTSISMPPDTTRCQGSMRVGRMRPSFSTACYTTPLRSFYPSIIHSDYSQQATSKVTSPASNGQTKAHWARIEERGSVGQTQGRGAYTKPHLNRFNIVAANHLQPLHPSSAENPPTIFWGCEDSYIQLLSITHNSKPSYWLQTKFIDPINMAAQSSPAHAEDATKTGDPIISNLINAVKGCLPSEPSSQDYDRKKLKEAAYKLSVALESPGETMQRFAYYV